MNRKILAVLLMSAGISYGALTPPSKPEALPKPANYSDMEIFNNVFSSVTNKLSVDATGSSVTVRGGYLDSVRQASVTVTGMPPVAVTQGSMTITNMPPISDSRYYNKTSTASAGVLITGGSVSFTGGMTELSVYTLGGSSDTLITSTFNDGIIHIIDGIPFNLTPVVPVANPTMLFELPLDCTAYYYITGVK